MTCDGTRVPPGQSYAQGRSSSERLGAPRGAPVETSGRVDQGERAELERHSVFRDREWTVDSIHLSLHEGLAFNAALDPTIAGVLAALDGTRTLDDVATDIARLQATDTAGIEESLLPVATEMLAAGFLVRSGAV